VQEESNSANVERVSSGGIAVNQELGGSALNALRIGNITSVIATIAISVLANLLPINGHTTAELADLYPNLFVPTGLTFGIWGVIYLLMLVFSVDQGIRIVRPVSDRATPIVGGWFILASLANIVYTFAWHHGQVFLSLIAILVIFASVLTLYIRLGVGRPGADRRERLMLHLLFKVYLGWVSVAIIAHVATWLVSIGWGQFGVSEVFWAIAVVIGATCLALVMLYDRRDVAFSLVVLWAFAGIVLKQAATGDPPLALLGALGVALSVIEVGILSVLWGRWTA